VKRRNHAMNSQMQSHKEKSENEQQSVPGTNFL
jgi:hypothetical protein